MKHLFCKRNPFKKACDSHDCKPCVSSVSNNIKIPDCRTNNIAYSATCKDCDLEGKEKTYIGETSRNLYSRSKEHYAALKHGSENSFMFKHITTEHANKPANFEWKILKKFVKPLPRQIYEANKISNTAPDVLLNSKQEFNHMNTKKLFIKKSQFQCNICSGKFDSTTILMNHIEQFHMKIICNTCQYEAIGRSDLKYHNKNIHKT